MCSNTNTNDLGLTDASCSCGTHAHNSAGATVTGVGLTTHTYEVSGMTCGHCVSSVTEEVSRLDGVSKVDVQLVPGGASLLTVLSAVELDRGAVAAAIDEAGYALAAEPQ
ncbi:heavy-metal-associated domain-containing protein [Cryobacterium roopkundense]|uniref:Copper chaperone CopZ n=1 Tax=Cryobacterium roopkundense TaxID=1001240 RepID=A0A7W8ZVU2_9MICO|nr:heavy-metal-associated domain-containing protein [Cryobacterium roopkundense]MBB5641082.1 copper chaperone CopZ [Cryobacterium roopkundense]